MEKQILNETFHISANSLKEHVSINQADQVMTIKDILLQKWGTKNKNKRVYKKETLEREIGFLTPKINERMLRGELDHPCLIEGKIMTYDGWKDLKDISDDELIYTLNTTNNNIELQRIYNKVDEPYSGTLYKFNGKNINITCTPNHRFLLIDRYGNSFFEIAENIYSDRKKFEKCFIPKIGMWSGKDEPVYKIDKIDKHFIKKYNEKYTNDLFIDSKLFFAFVGLYLAEGGVHKNKKVICIHQKKYENVIKIRELLNKLSPELEWKEYVSGNNKKHVFYCSDNRLYNFLKKLGTIYTKRIPEDMKQWDKKYLEEMFEWFLLGDGSIIKDNKYIKKYVASTSFKMIEDFQEVLFKIGFASTITEQELKDRKIEDRIIKKENSKPLWRLNVNTSNGIYLDSRFLNIEKIDNYEGRIYCVSVENKTFLCKNEEKMFWSGNSERLVVNLDNVSHMITKVYWKGNELRGDLEIFKTPKGLIAETLIKQKSPFGISSRGSGTLAPLTEDTMEVQDDLELVTWDLVSDPSTIGAYVNLNENELRQGYKNLKALYEEDLRKNSNILLRQIDKALNSNRNLTEY